MQTVPRLRRRTCLERRARPHARFVLVELFHRVGDLFDQFHVKEVMRRTLHLNCADKARVLVDANIRIVSQRFYLSALYLGRRLNRFR
jgi:hypothetical protein